jgi:hypothetical protein
MRSELRPLFKAAMEGVLAKARYVLEETDQLRAQGLADVAKERTKGLADVTKERAKGLADVAKERLELQQEVKAMQTHQEVQEGRVELNIGGYRFETSVNTLRRVPHTFFDAYFSGRYAQDVCSDGSIFVDRDGKHFGHVLEYMWDGIVAVGEPGARPSKKLLRVLKREFGLYCIELVVKQAPGMAFVMGGYRSTVAHKPQASMERYDSSSNQWSTMASLGTARAYFAACVLEGEVYVTGGAIRFDGKRYSTVEKYSPSSDTWSVEAPLPEERCCHAAVTVGADMYVLGGVVGAWPSASVLKFNRKQGRWSKRTAMPAATAEPAVCAVGSNIYAFGGYNNRGHQQTSVFMLDTKADTPSSLAP